MSEILGGGFREFSYRGSKNTPTLLLGDIVTFYHFGMHVNNLIVFLFYCLVR